MASTNLTFYETIMRLKSLPFRTNESTGNGSRTGVKLSIVVLALAGVLVAVILLIPLYATNYGSPPALLESSRLGEFLGGSTNTTTSSNVKPGWAGDSDSNATAHRDVFFEQVYSLASPPPRYDFHALRTACERTTWRNHGSNGTNAGSESANTRMYLQCEGIYLGLTSVMSQVKSCLKMAIEGGVGLILPSIPLRDASDYFAYNQGNPDSEKAFGEWFDEAHFVEVMGRVCPQMDIMHPREIEEEKVVVEATLSLDLTKAPFWRDRDGYFWAGKPFREFFETELVRVREEEVKRKEEERKKKEEEKAKKVEAQIKTAKGQQAREEADKSANQTPRTARQKRRMGRLAGLVSRHPHDVNSDPEGPAASNAPSPSSISNATVSTSITILSMRADFELFNLVQDVTGHELALWDDLSRLLRFLDGPRHIVHALLGALGGTIAANSLHGEMSATPAEDRKARPFFGVHFRGERDNIWATPEEQIRVDLDALDRAWAMYNSTGDFTQRPPVHLACGDEAATAQFVSAGDARGWHVTSKYALARSLSDTSVLEQIEALPFDFQAIIDLGIMVQSYFFVGLAGSAFSYTVAHVRDPMGRYRGSTFDLGPEGDGGARTHMFPNLNTDRTMERYACCL